MTNERAPRGGRPPSGTGRPGARKPGPAKSGNGRPANGKRPSGKPAAGKPATGKPPAGKPRGERPTGRPGSRPAGGGAKPRPPRRAEQARTDDRPRDPHLPDSVTADQLDPSIANELRTLPEGLAEIVGRHLVAADLALVDEDITLARQHVAAAKRRAGRVAAVREAAGITAYLAGDYTEAISELRTVRRMTGSNEYVPMLADCERGLGRPEKALELIKEIDARTVDAPTRVELLLVSAGARADMGQLDAALVTLQVPELRSLKPGAARARIQYAYADLLDRVGRFDESRDWMRQAAASDVDGVTDAAERLDEEAGVAFFEEEEDAPLDGEGNPQP